MGGRLPRLTFQLLVDEALANAGSECNNTGKLAFAVQPGRDGGVKTQDYTKPRIVLSLGAQCPSSVRQHHESPSYTLSKQTARTYWRRVIRYGSYLQAIFKILHSISPAKYLLH